MWTWSIAHLLGCFYHEMFEERELRAEARLLLDRVCLLPRGYPAGSSLIRCDEARSILGAGPLLLVALQRTGGAVVLDALAAARREVSAALRVVGLLGAAVAAVLVAAQILAMRCSEWCRRDREEKEGSEFRRSKESSFVTMPSYLTPLEDDKED